MLSARCLVYSDTTGTSKSYTIYNPLSQRVKKNHINIYVKWNIHTKTLMAIHIKDVCVHLCLITKANTVFLNRDVF